MKLTKYEHSCFTLEKDDKTIVIDPGAWTTDFVADEHTVAVVVTHEHMDHFDPETLRAIVEKNPDVVIYAPQAVVALAEDLPMRIATPGEKVEVGDFALEFVGGKHAIIHADFHPIYENIGVIVDDTVYHPGDSLELPGKPVKVLSLPIVAPWEKVSESVDFLIAVKPEIAFPSHDAFLNEMGHDLYDRWHQMASDKYGISYQRLHGSIEI